MGVKAIDDHTLEVTLSEPVPYFYKLLVHPSTFPVNQKAVEKYGEKWTQPANWVGNGAYTLKEWVVNEKIVLERNPNYWDNAHTIINKVTYLPISSEVTDVNRYRSGEIDMTYNNLPIELFQKLKKEIPNEVKADPYLCTYYYEINNQKAPFNDARVRQALVLGLDQDILVNKVKAQGDTPAFGFTPPYIDGLDGKLTPPEWVSWSREKRNAEAKKLLAEAGFTPEKPLTFNLLYNTSDLHKKTGDRGVLYLEKQHRGGRKTGKSGVENIPGQPSSGHIRCRSCWLVCGLQRTDHVPEYHDFQQQQQHRTL
ncbi:hypothetical protein OS21_25650 [Dickeya oryzae]